MSLNDVSDISALLSGEDRDVAQLEAELLEKRSSIMQQEDRVCIFERFDGIACSQTYNLIHF